MAKRLLGVAAISSASLALALPSAASAGKLAGERTFSQSFPVASKLCETVAAGKERKALVPVAAAILADCETVKASFATASTTVLTTRVTVRAQIAADKAAIKTSCPTPSAATKPACVSTRHTENVAIKGLHASMIAAIHAYYNAVDAARHTFWAAIKTLRPLHHAVADKPIKVQNS